MRHGCSMYKYVQTQHSNVTQFVRQSLQVVKGKLVSMYCGVMAGNSGWGILEEGWRKGPWTVEEDKLLIEYVTLQGEGRWNSVARFAGLKRNGKSCRLRWVNYLRPDLKREQITPHEENIIVELHARWGNRWSTIAQSLPGRTDNEIKNYWRTHFKKKGKISSEHSEKSNTRHLRKQQFQLLKQQQQQQHQQQQNQVDHMKRIMYLLDESDKFLYPNTSEEESLLPFAFNGNTYVPEASGEDILWGGLWNLDDIHTNLDSMCATGKASVHNLVAPFC